MRATWAGPVVLAERYDGALQLVVVPAGCGQACPAGEAYADPERRDASRPGVAWMCAKV